jgi:magnesium-transporting ATPase (P-type)
MIAGQIGTAFAVRTQRASLRLVGVFTNRNLLGGIAAEIVLAVVFVYAPPMQALLGTAALLASDLLILLPFPVIVWGADEFMCYLLRRFRPIPQDGGSRHGALAQPPEDTPGPPMGADRPSL